MTVPAVNAVGFCAHYSQQGDWAFDFAVDLARRRQKKLNIFHFMADPYDPQDEGPINLSAQQYRSFLIEREKELRLYYDSLLGDYLEAGFRLCEDKEWTELHRCLYGREFQVLVLGYPREGARFGGVPIEEFASSFVSPVVLVGPGSRRELRLNPPAALISERLDPHSVKKAVGKIGAGGSVGVALGGLLAERVGAMFDATAMLAVLAALHGICGLIALMLRSTTAAPAAEDAAKPIPPQMTMTHPAAVRSLSVSVDNAKVATCGDDSVVRVWDLASGRELQRFAEHEAAALSVSFAADNKTLVSASADKSARVWNLSATRLVVAHEGPVRDLALLAAGAQAATVGDDQLAKPLSH